MTPLSWSLIRELDNESIVIPGYYSWSGNICGRSYSNVSRRVSGAVAFYGEKTGQKMRQLLDEVFGQIPEQIALPIHPFPKGPLLKQMLPKILHLLRNYSAASKGMPAFLANTPAKSRRMREQIRSATTPGELLPIWTKELHSASKKAWWALVAGGAKGVLGLNLKKKLIPLVGVEDANALLSHLRGNAELASLGPAVGIAQVIKGEISCHHRGRCGEAPFEAADSL